MRRTRGDVGHDGEVLVKQIELGVVAQQVHRGLVEAGDGADVLPKAVELVAVQALALAEQLGDDVLAKVVARALVQSVLLERLDQHIGREDVDAHGREVRIGLIGLLGELGDAAVLGVGGQDAKAAGLLPRYGHNAHREVGVVLNVRLEHLAVVHAIQVIARKNQDVLGVVGLDVVEVLRNGVGRARIPGAAGLRLVRRQDRHAAVAAVQIPRLAGTNIGMQQVGAILRQNAHRVDARVGAVGERKVDNAELATKANRRLSDLLGECPQSAALSSCEEHRDAFFLTHRFLLLSSMFLNPLASDAAQRHARRVMPCWHR